MPAMPSMPTTTKDYVQVTDALLRQAHRKGALAAELSANKLDIERGWVVARDAVIQQQIAAAYAKGLTDVSRRWLIWSEVVKAMDNEEAHHYKAAGCCVLAWVWLRNLFAIMEMAFRISWHGFMAGFWGLLLRCRKEDPTVIANVGYHGLAVSAYTAASGVISRDLHNPSRPSRTFKTDSSLERPVPPLAAGESLPPDAREDTIRPRGLLQNICFACQAQHPFENAEHIGTGLFCTMGGCRACHPSVCCGPCCRPCRMCYDTLPQRITKWNHKEQGDRSMRLHDFYMRNFKVNSYEEHVERRLREMASQPPEAHETMRRGVDVQDLEEGVLLGVLEAFVGKGPPRNTPSAPARAALGVVKGMAGMPVREAGDARGIAAEVAGAERGQLISAPVLQALSIMQAIMGDLRQQAQQRGPTAAAAAQSVKRHATEENQLRAPLATAV